MGCVMTTTITTARRALVGDWAGGLSAGKPIGNVLPFITDAGLDDDRVVHNLWGGVCVVGRPPTCKSHTMRVMGHMYSSGMASSIAPGTVGAPGMVFSDICRCSNVTVAFMGIVTSCTTCA